MPSNKDLESIPTTRSLTAKQLRFIEEYINGGFNAYQAAVAAGYSKKTAAVQAHDNLKKPNILAEIQKKRDQLTEKSQDKVIAVLQRLSEIINADITDYVDDTGEYSPTKNGFNGKLINSIRKGRNGTTVTLCSKDKALELLGKYLSMWQDKIDITTQGQAVAPIQITFEEVGSTEEAPPT